MSSLYKALVGLFRASLLFGLGMWFGLTVISPQRSYQSHARVAAVPLGTATPSDAATPRRIEKAKPAEAITADPEADRKLSPVHPAEPGEPKPALDAAGRQSPADQVAKTDAANNDATNGSARSAAQEPVKATGSTAARPQRTRIDTASAPSAASASSQDDRKPEPQIHAASLSTSESVNQSANRCDVRACASAYKSFRESDCSYQPFSGPRRLCVSPPTTAQRDESKPAGDHARAQTAAPVHDAGLDGAVRAVERLTAGRRWSTEPETMEPETSDVPDRYNRAPRVYVLPDDDEDE
jgi:hypothetical protein